MSEHLPFRQVVNIRTLPRKGRRAGFEPNASELEGIARHLGVTAAREGGFEAEIVPWRRDGVRVSGRVALTVEQPCVVSLEPVVTRLDEPFETILVPAGSKLAAPPTSELLDAEGDDPPETFEGDTIDLAELWLEFLALAVDPFPRAPGAELPDATADEKPSPFAALAALKAANDG